MRMRPWWADPSVEDPDVTPAEYAAAQAARRRREVGEGVRRARLARRLPVARLAAVTGISRGVIEDLEAGEPVDVGTAVLIAEAVGLDVVAATTRYAQNPPVSPSLDLEDGRLPAPLD
jgi:transcriptional regulator with XRE-family HTH domain